MSTPFSLKVYLAAPLFSRAELMFNVDLARRLEVFAGVYLPQRDGYLMSEMTARGVPQAMAGKAVFNGDVDAILGCDVLVAVLDGRTIDEGVAFELGVAYAAKKLCVGLQTDPRRLAPWGNNPMISGALAGCFSDIEGLATWFSDRFFLGNHCSKII